jgi:hypothetical protein
LQNLDFASKLPPHHLLRLSSTFALLSLTPE